MFITWCRWTPRCCTTMWWSLCSTSPASSWRGSPAPSAPWYAQAQVSSFTFKLTLSCRGTYKTYGQCCGTATFCLSGTGTVVHSSSGSGSGSGQIRIQQKLKYPTKVKKFKSKARWKLSGQLTAKYGVDPVRDMDPELEPEAQSKLFQRRNRNRNKLLRTIPQYCSWAWSSYPVPVPIVIRHCLGGTVGTHLLYSDVLS